MKSEVVKEWLSLHSWQNSNCMFLNSMLLPEHHIVLTPSLSWCMHVCVHAHICAHTPPGKFWIPNSPFLLIYVFQKVTSPPLKKNSYFKQRLLQDENGIFQIVPDSNVSNFLLEYLWKHRKGQKHSRENQDCLSTHCQNLGVKPAKEKDNSIGLRNSPQPVWAEGLETRTQAAWTKGRLPPPPPSVLCPHTASSLNRKISHLFFYSTAAGFFCFALFCFSGNWSDKQHGINCL